MKRKHCVIDKIIVYPEITERENQTQAFLDWTELITYEDNWIILPDESKLDGKTWMNISLQFDNGSYTEFLQNYYAGLN